MAKLNFSVKTQTQEGDLAVERNTRDWTGYWVFAYLLLPSFLDSVLLESQSRDDDF